ncbi:MAG: outer membrane beta-barrel protein [bacterium]|jgi:opacity protein-like surface antigen
MRKHLALVLAGLFVAVTATAAVAAEYDRYERGPSGGSGEYAPPPRRGAEVRPPRHALYGEPYFFAHLGIFDPNDDADGLRGYESGSTFDVGFGSRVAPMFAFEGAFGAYGADDGSREARVAPLTVGARLIVPTPFIEPYIGAGLGLYFSSLDESVNGIDDTSTDLGGYLSAGVDLWLNQRVALNFEGKYHFVNPTFQNDLGNDVDVDMSGWAINLGVRIAF